MNEYLPAAADFALEQLCQAANPDGGPLAVLATAHERISTESKRVRGTLDEAAAVVYRADYRKLAVVKARGLDGHAGRVVYVTLRPGEPPEYSTSGSAGSRLTDDVLALIRETPDGVSARMIRDRVAGVGKVKADQFAERFVADGVAHWHMSASPQPHRRLVAGPADDCQQCPSDPTDPRHGPDPRLPRSDQ